MLDGRCWEAVNVSAVMRDVFEFKLEIDSRLLHLPDEMPFYGASVFLNHMPPTPQQYVHKEIQPKTFI